MTSTTPTTYGNWRLPKSAGIIGLGRWGTFILLGGLVVVLLVAMTTTLFHALGVMAVLGLAVFAVLHRDVHQRNLLDRGSTRLGWWLNRGRNSSYRSGPLGRTGWGTHQLPGLAAPLRLTEYQDSYERPFALLHCPATSTYTVIFVSEPEGASFKDQSSINSLVDSWAMWLSNIAEEPGVKAASVTIETSPDSGARLRREVYGQLDPAAPSFARDVLMETVESFPAGSSMVRSYVAVTFDARSRLDKHRRSAEEMGRDLGTRLPAMTLGLTEAGAGAVRPMTAQQLCELVRMAYDPEAATIIEGAHAAGEQLDVSWVDAGPSATEQEWDCYRHDSGWSVTWAMSTAPRGFVHSSVLNRLLAPHPDLVRKRVTLLFRPVDPAVAAKMVEDDLTDAEFRVRAARRATAAENRSLLQAARSAEEEAAGAGVVAFGLLVTATVLDKAHLPRARATVDSLSSTARLRMRTVYGAQDSAFAAALPLGLVLPAHLKVPNMQGRL